MPERVHGRFYRLSIKGYGRLGAHPQNKNVGIPSPEMVVDQDENGCRFEEQGKNPGTTLDLHG